jgi:cell division protein FtsB
MPMGEGGCVSMFRVLGILIVVLILMVVSAALINARVVRPARSRKHIARLEAENERLDALLHEQERKEAKA